MIVALISSSIGINKLHQNLGLFIVSVGDFGITTVTPDAVIQAILDWQN